MSDPTPRPRTRFPLFVALAWCAAIAALALTVFAAAWHDVLGRASSAALLAHYIAFMCQTFSFHAGIAMAPVLLLALLAKRRRLLIVAVGPFALGAIPELITLWPRPQAYSNRPELKLMSVNLMYGHMDAPALLAQISRESPDAIVFQEWTPDGAAQLRASLAVTHPHSIEEPRDDAFGQAVFSRRAFAEPPRSYPPIGGFHEPQICFSLLVDERAMRLTNVHLLPPISRSYFAQQRLGAFEMWSWQADRSRSDQPDVLAGDFNSTSRSGIVSTILGTGMRDTQRDTGWWRGSTWPRVGTLAYVPGLQLDHVLIGSRVECVEARVGEDFESDHRPVIVRLRWR